MSEHLVLYIDDEPRMEAPRAGVPGQLRAWLARLDADMDEGIQLDDLSITNPGSEERRRFVLGRLLAAFAEGETEYARGLLFYIALRSPDLAAIRVRSGDGAWMVDLEPA